MFRYYVYKMLHSFHFLSDGEYQQKLKARYFNKSNDYLAVSKSLTKATIIWLFQNLNFLMLIGICPKIRMWP